MLADETCRDTGDPETECLLYATYWFRPILSELIGELAAGELVVDEHRNSGCPVSQRAFCPEGLGGRKPWCLVVYEQAQGSVMGSTQPEG